MAKSGMPIPRRPGRPEADNRVLIDDTLAEWVQTGGPNGQGLDQAVRVVCTADRALREHVNRVKSLRKRVRDALAYMGREEMLLRAVDVARERGILVPQWLSVELAETQHRNREIKAELAANPEIQRLIQEWEATIAAANQPLARYNAVLRRQQAEADRVRRLTAFCVAFDVPADTPISQLVWQFDACAKFRTELLRRQK
jgi:hypothetical protein